MNEITNPSVDGSLAAGESGAISGGAAGESTELTTGQKLETLTAEINAIKSQTMAVIRNNSLEIGQRLCEAKKLAGHGNWLTWLKTVGYGERTAEQFMAIYQKYGLEGNQVKLIGENLDATKVKNLSKSALVALLDIKDDDERAHFINTENVEDMSTRELKAKIQELKEAKEKAEAGKAKSDKEIAWLERRAAEAEEKAAAAKSKAAQAKSKTDAEMEQMKADLEYAESERDDIQKQLTEAQKALEEAESRPVATAVVKEIPEETKQEIEEMKRKLTAANETIENLRRSGAKDENETRFLSAFEDTKKSVQAMITAAGNMKDPAMQAKYRGGAKRFLEMMADMAGGQ